MCSSIMIKFYDEQQSIDGVAAWKHAVSSGSRLGPNPCFPDIVVIEISPEIILATLCFAPIPRFLNVQVRPIHIAHVPAISELGELGLCSEGCLTQIVSSRIARDLDSSYWVCDCDNSSSPSFVKRLVWIGVRSEIRIVVIVRSAEHFRMNDAEQRQTLSASSVSKLRIAPIARHSSDEAVFLFRPYGGCESESLFVGNSLAEVRVELLDWIAGSRTCQSQAQEQAYQEALCTS